MDAKIFALQNWRSLNAVEIMAMRDLLEFLEQASDMIVRIVNYVRILASEKSEISDWKKLFFFSCSQRLVLVVYRTRDISSP